MEKLAPVISLAHFRKQKAQEPVWALVDQGIYIQVSLHVAQRAGWPTVKQPY